MNTQLHHNTNSLHDKIAEQEQAYQAAVNERKDYYTIKILKAGIEALKKKLKRLEASFHDEFKKRFS